MDLERQLENNQHGPSILSFHLDENKMWKIQSPISLCMMWEYVNSMKFSVGAKLSGYFPMSAVSHKEKWGEVNNYNI